MGKLTDVLHDLEVLEEPASSPPPAPQTADTPSPSKGNGKPVSVVNLAALAERAVAALDEIDEMVQDLRQTLAEMRASLASPTLESDDEEVREEG